MSTIFSYIPHRHAEERVVPPTVAATALRMHGPGLIGRLNATVGLRITLVVGTMWCAYAFTILALISAPAAFASGNALVIVAWVAQTFLQLVLLPIIIVGQNVQAASADKRAEATFDDATMILAEVRQIQAHLLAQDVVVEQLRRALGGSSPAAAGLQ